MDLRELGALLKAERERRGISPNDVTEQIKISRSTLDAIEEGQEDKLPHRVYAKGFIKNYARLLDIDPDEVAQTLASAFGVEEDALSRPAYHESKGSISSIRTGQPGGKKSSALAITILLLLVIGGAALWYFSFFTPKESGQSGQPEQSQASAPSQDQTAPAASEQSGSEFAAPQSPASSLDGPASSLNGQESETDAAILPGQNAEPSAPESASEQVLSESAPASAGESLPDQTQTQSAAPDQLLPADQADQTAPAAGEGVLLGEGPNIVVITAKETCWLEAAADGGAMNELTLRKGESLTGRFEDVLLVRLGNAGGVAIHFNGKPYAFDGASGQVKTLKFTTKKPGAAAAPAAADGAQASAAPPGTSSQTSEPASPSTGEPAQETAAPVTPGEKTLTAFGADGSWIIVIPDGKGAREIFVKRGERLQFGFQKSIEVRLGNPSKLVFTYDGKEYPVSTERGESKSVRFPE